MSKWRVSIPSWETEVEADDEGDALVQASMEHDFMDDASAEEIVPDNEE